MTASLTFLVLGLAPAPLLAQHDPWIHIVRYCFNINPKTPLKDLLPAPPRTVPFRTLLVQDLAQVPE